MSIWRDYYRDGPSTYDSAYQRNPNRVIVVLILINVAVFVITAFLLARGGPDMRDTVSRLFLHPSDLIDRFYLWQLVTYGFCHSINGIFHILFNMLFLWWFGRRLVSRFGTVGFITFYLAAIVFSGLIYTFWEVLNGSLLATGGMLGASGGVMGIVIAYACYYPHERLHLIFPPISLKVWHFAAFYLGIDVFFGLVLEADTGVAHLAHLGGALWGFVWFRFHDKVRAKMAELDGGGKGAPIATVSKPKRDKAAEKEKEVRAKVEALLERISKDGIGSLSEKEKKFLKDASSRYGSS